MWQVDGGFDLWHESEHQIYSAEMFLQNISPICGDKIKRRKMTLNYTFGKIQFCRSDLGQSQKQL